MNARISAREVKEHCKLTTEGLVILEKAVSKFGFSARGYSRILKIARTIADLDESHGIEQRHVAEAITYRVSRL